jgi:hypothetical protein
MKNYRPTSLLMVFFFFLRKLCTTPADTQHNDHQTDDFRKGIPTENAAFRVTDCILKSINQNNACGRNFLWFGKGFWLCESWNFVSSITTLWNSRCSWRLVQMLCKKQKSQRVEVPSPNSTKNFFSDWGTLKHRVPQWSIVVSLLFITYIYI